MPSTRDIRRRIKSVKNTAQITKAMQMVAASKMRKAQQAALAGRPYAQLMNKVLAAVAAESTGDTHPFLEKREGAQRCAFRSARSAFLPWFTGAMLAPFDMAANTATPRSIPTAGRMDGIGSATSRCHWTATCHCPARRETVALQMVPGMAYQPRSRTHPSFGSLIRPDELPVRSTLIETGSGNLKLSFSPFLRGVG